MEPLLIIPIAIMILSLVLFVRNLMVYNFRVKLINYVATNVDYQDSWEYWSAFHASSYNEMMIKFWKPRASFFKGTVLEKAAKEISCGRTSG